MGVLVQTSQLSDGSQMRTTVNPDGSIYYDNLLGGSIQATSAWDINGNNLFNTELQNSVPTILSQDGVSTGITPFNTDFFDAVSVAQSQVVGNPASALPETSQPITLSETNIETPNGVVGSLPIVSGTDAQVLNDLTQPTPVNIVGPTQIAGAGRVTKALQLPHGELGPGHINTGVGLLRHFTFVLSDGINGKIYSLELNINPEDLMIDTPYRVGAYNTMGGAFVDVWGQGIRKIVMKGHTGWRTYQTTTQIQDGYDNFFALHEDIVNRYFTLREQASNDWPQQKIENLLTLQIVDRLHNKTYFVVPEQFRLLRNKARPLLHLYEVSFIIVNPQVAQNGNLNPLSLSDKTKQLQNGFGASSSRFDALKKALKEQVKNPFSNALSDLHNMGGGITQTFKNLLQAKKDITQGAAGIQNIYSSAMHSVSRAIGSLQAFTDLGPIAADVKFMISDTKQAFNELACLIDQIKHLGLLTYTGIVGSCACCTALFGTKGSPLATVGNTFSTLKAGGDEAQLLQASNVISPKAQTISSKINNLDIPMVLRGNQ